MKSKLLNIATAVFSLHSFFWAFNCYAQSKEEHLHELRRQYNCTIYYQRGVDLYKLIVLYKLGDETYYLRLNQLIKISSELNTKFIDYAYQYKELAHNNANPTETFEVRLKKIAKNERKLEFMLEDLEVWEASNLVTFFSLHNYVSEQVEVIASIKLDLEQFQCNEASETMNQLIANLEKWNVTLSKTRLYIEESRRKRQMILNDVVDHVYKKMVSDQLIQTANRSDESLERMKSLINYSRLSEGFFETWLLKTRNGIARGLDTRYLMFNEPIQILRELAAFLDSNATKFASIKGIDESARQDLLGRINIYKKSVSDRLDRLLKEGWQRQFEKQKLMNQERMKKIDRFSNECRISLTRFKEKESSIKTGEEFQMIQNLYGDIVSLCTAKN